MNATLLAKNQSSILSLEDILVPSPNTDGSSAVVIDVVSPSVVITDVSPSAVITHV